MNHLVEEGQWFTSVVSLLHTTKGRLQPKAYKIIRLDFRGLRDLVAALRLFCSISDFLNQ